MQVQEECIQYGIDQISSNTKYQLLTDYSKEYKNMHRNDKHHIQEHATSGEGGKRKGLERKTKEASNVSHILSQ